MPEVHIVSAGPEDDAAAIALQDISHALATEDDWCIVGGHMTSLLMARFPSVGFVERRTGDADAGIPVQVARDGTVHERLVAAGYVGELGNRYVKPGSPRPTIDLLVPAYHHVFQTQSYGGRMFDAMPGLPLALAASRRLDVVSTRQDRTEHAFTTRVPSVESAVVLKAAAWGLRMQRRDGVDLHNLFSIVRAGHAIGTWMLGEAELPGARLDAARHLHSLADSWEARPPGVRFDHRLLVTSIRRTVTRPQVSADFA